MVIFHSHVTLPEGNPFVNQSKIGTSIVATEARRFEAFRPKGTHNGPPRTSEVVKFRSNLGMDQYLLTPFLGG